MIIFFMKLASSIRKAIAGRKYPYQLAWAVAFGLLLGIVPHGNVLAVSILVLVLTLRVNHAMAGLTAVGVSFVAGYLDPYSHQVGDYLLSHPQIHDYAVAAWQLPMVPWTDLNNTVVLGSLLIGTAALVPTFAITYPFFRFMAPAKGVDVDAGMYASRAGRKIRRQRIDNREHAVVVVDQRHEQVASRHEAEAGREAGKVTGNVGRDEAPDFREVEDDANSRSDSGVSEAIADDEQQHSDAEQVAVETRVDVIRMQDFRSVENDQTDASNGRPDTDDQPMDEALNYLLRQLRDSQQRKAA